MVSGSPVSGECFSFSLFFLTDGDIGDRDFIFIGHRGWPFLFADGDIGENGEN